MKKHRIGIMQGRLTEPKGRGIQFFPFENWENEFYLAAKLGFDEIEFIFDLDRYRENPLWTSEGIRRIRQTIARSGVGVNHVCADFFMRRPFFRVSAKEREENIEILKRLLKNSSEIGACYLEIPVLDNSSIKNPEEEKILIDILRQCLPTAEDCGVEILLESDYPAERLILFLESVHPGKLGAVFDSGNASALGFDPYRETATLRSKVKNVHIKDRLLNGGSVALGTGAADFDGLFRALRETGYQGGFILQAARGKEGEEGNNIAEQIHFTGALIKKYV